MRTCPHIIAERFRWVTGRCEITKEAYNDLTNTAELYIYRYALHLLHPTISLYVIEVSQINYKAVAVCRYSLDIPSQREGMRMVQDLHLFHSTVNDGIHVDVFV